VNVYTTGDQWSPAVARGGDGNFVVVWSGYKDGSGYGIFARRFDSSGAPLGGELQVTTHTPTVPARRPR
jgi:hypothetical protein